ncbi:MAG: hypothetical protein AAB453_02995 [Patescibacteria group bacterium]
MSTITLPKIEYQELKKKAARYEAVVRVPTYYLRGKEAMRLDKRVEGAMREYLNGKTKRIKSLADLV